MKSVKFNSNWETIYQYIGRALWYAVEHNVICECEFNGGNFTVTPKSNMDSAYEDWQKAMQKQEEEYKKSDAYKKYQKEQEEQGCKMNKEVVVLIEKFDTLDLTPTTFEGMKAILDWLVKYQNYSDNTLCTASNEHYILEKLKENGYVKDMWVGAPKDTFDDMTCYFEYIVGQAISTMEFLALHPMIKSFRDKWVKEFENKEC